MEEEEYYKYLEELPIGRKYFVPRRELEVTAPRIPVLPEREIKPEAIKIKKRPEGVVLPQIPKEEKTPLVFAEVQTSETHEKGYSQHRYLQALIKRIAEEKGFRAKIEKPILDGKGRVDVELEIDNKKIACEISITSSPVQELANIKKCFQAGYKEVILCSPKAKNLKRIKHRAYSQLNEADLQRVRFLRPEELFSYLEELATSTLTKEERLRGYTVRVQYQPIGEAERKAKREAVAQVILQSLRRQAQKSKEV